MEILWRKPKYHNTFKKQRFLFVCFLLADFSLKLCFCQQHDLEEDCMLIFLSGGHDFCVSIFENGKMVLYCDSQFLKIGGTLRNPELIK